MSLEPNPGQWDRPIISTTYVSTRVSALLQLSTLNLPQIYLKIWSDPDAGSISPQTRNAAMTIRQQIPPN